MKIIHILCLTIATFCSTTYAQTLKSHSVEGPQAELPAGPLTEIQFEEAIFNFGEVENGEIIQTVFSFTNSGDEPLLITNAKGSCGCTVPAWPKEPIMPGESGEFVVRFNSKNKVGLTSKRVTITANTTPANTYLTVKGKVIERKIEAGKQIEKAVISSERSSLQHFNKDMLKIYPNPANELINVEVNDLVGKDISVSIFNSLGKRIDHRTIKDFTSQVLEFDTSKLNKGMYSLSVRAEGHHRISKLFSVIN